MRSAYAPRSLDASLRSCLASADRRPERQRAATLLGMSERNDDVAAAECEYRAAMENVFRLFVDAVLDRAAAVRHAEARGVLSGFARGYSDGWGDGWKAAAKVIADGLTPEVRALLGPDLEAFLNAPDASRQGRPAEPIDPNAAALERLEEQLEKGTIKPN
jgi:hypothetical protein